MPPNHCLSAFAILAACNFQAAAAPAPSAPAFVAVHPAAVKLLGNFARAQVLVRECDAAGVVTDASIDFTRRAAYRVENPQVAKIDSHGRLTALANGATVVHVAVGGATKTAAVVVEGVVADPKIGFTEQVMPILSKAGCNAAACHASQYGKGFFKLSVFGYDPNEDYNAIVRYNAGRRVSVLNPEQSLFLTKPTAVVDHGGDRRIAPGSIEHEIIRRWIAAGAPRSAADAPIVSSLEVTPARRLGAKDFRQQLQVVAKYSDGVSRDVTAQAKYIAMDQSIARVDFGGEMHAVASGQAPVLVRFEGQAAISLVVVPRDGGAANVDLTGFDPNHVVDKFAAAKFREQGVQPSAVCDDAAFVR
ncbi:MAG: hypothetical protein ACRC1K_01990, partial [Planctomycetia bacterium]